ncbi:MAG: beta-ketoacyl-ACP synthase II [Synergistaceae bacterium]|nr:beta-ketoacyl-ACP synthase II [Synergistaceae bacterium]
MRRVVITGLGPVSPIGIGKDDFWKALREKVNGVGLLTEVELYDSPINFGAEIKNFDPTVWMDNKEARRSDRAIQFAVAASVLAVEDAKLDTSSLDPYRFGVYVGSGQGGISTSFDQFKIMLERGAKKISPFFIPMMISNMSTAYVAIRHKAKGPNLCVVTACATSIHSLGEAYHAIIRNDADVMISGGTEAGLKAICLAGFASMKALSTRREAPEKASRPFDKDRDGFVMGEGAGALILEEYEFARKRGAHIYAELVGYGTSCDAEHITAPAEDGNGAAYATQKALLMAGWKTQDVDYINAHGTSTPLNDKTEALMINNIFGEHTPDIAVNSTKSLIGHCLGAAGALETIATIQAFEEGYIHPTLNYEIPDPECSLNVITGDGLKKPIKHALINSFGFGGHNGVIGISKI